MFIQDAEVGFQKTRQPAVVGVEKAEMRSPRFTNAVIPGRSWDAVSLAG